MPLRSVRRKSSGPTMVLRITAGVLFLYLLWLYPYTLRMMGDWISGAFWLGSPAGTLFPIPTMPGILEAIVAANAVDSFIYLALYSTCLWLLYAVFAVPFAFSPWRITTKPEAEVIWNDS
jgi:glucan phosphoethanolaminetransferase (alkaline phosphatase superfamily)